MFGQFVGLFFKFIARSGSGVVENFGFGDFGAEIVEDDFVLHWSERIWERFFNFIVFLYELS